ncbi:MAG: rRNA pseudouridine synthase [Spirochaetaceae bacterium]|jgi:23S rRNA pseudouridine2605 synthase|nr:rRNA pseudouridine synthase [Spirochaetaceae bacterium]
MAENDTCRLQVFLSHAGVSSRRAAEKLILAGRIKVNGQIVTTLGTKVQAGDTVLFDSKPVQPESALHYLALNKPPLFLCSQSDPENRPLARGLLPRAIHERLYSVGRLDYLSSGLIFFTNDGAFAARLSHPSNRIEKEYFVESVQPIPSELAEQFSSGITIEGIKYQAARLRQLDERTINITLIEGKNREIRRVFSHFHIHPKTLRRIRIGPVELGSLAEGRSRPLEAGELSLLNTLPTG